jgi:hypothetical protein
MSLGNVGALMWAAIHDSFVVSAIHPSNSSRPNTRSFTASCALVHGVLSSELRFSPPCSCSPYLRFDPSLFPTAKTMTSPQVAGARYPPVTTNRFVCVTERHRTMSPTRPRRILRAPTRRGLSFLLSKILSSYIRVCCYYIRPNVYGAADVREWPRFRPAATKKRWCSPRLALPLGPLRAPCERLLSLPSL